MEIKRSKLQGIYIILQHFISISFSKYVRHPVLINSDQAPDVIMTDIVVKYLTSDIIYFIHEDMDIYHLVISSCVNTGKSLIYIFTDMTKY